MILKLTKPIAERSETTIMSKTFRFMDFLTPEEQELFKQFREKLGGKILYIPYPDADYYFDFLAKRNRKIKKMYARLKKLGLSDRVIYAEISIRLSCAHNLSQSRLRAIIKGYVYKRTA